jgi:hypothetical protein
MPATSNRASTNDGRVERPQYGIADGVLGMQLVHFGAGDGTSVVVVGFSTNWV